MAVSERGRRSVWWWVHHWLGLKLSLFMTFILATGTLAVFAHEIDWLLDPAQRAMPRAEAQASWGAWAEAVRTAQPRGAIETIQAPIDPWFAVRSTVRRPDGSRVFVYVNPWTSEVQAVRHWFTVQRFLRNTHRHLMMPVKVGLPIVCSLALVLLASLVTGLVAYKKFWRGFLRIPKWRSGRPGEGRRFVGDLHRFAGLWSIWFLALIVATSVWYLVEWGGGSAPAHPRPPEVTGAAQPTGGALDRLMAEARAAYPELRPTGVWYPDEDGRGLKVEGHADALLVRERSNAVWLDPASSETVLIARGEELSVHQRISEMADPLHFGTFGGLLTKTVWFLFGALMTGLSVTGVLIYSLRMKKAEAPTRRTGFWLRLWRGLGPAAYPTAALILISLALTPGAILAGGAG